MPKYEFITETTMREHNRSKYWIDRDYIKRYYIESNSLQEALNQYIETVNREHYDIISKNAVKNKQPIYIDLPDGEIYQVGYSFVARTLFDKGNYQGWTTQSIELWVTILETHYPNFDEDDFQKG